MLRRRTFGLVRKLHCFSRFACLREEEEQSVAEDVRTGDMGSGDRDAARSRVSSHGPWRGRPRRMRIGVCRHG